MRFYLKFFAILLSFSITQLIHGAQLRISQSPLSKLIDPPFISSVFRDSRELLWIGTHDGLYKFDGVNLTLFSSDADNENWIPTSEIRSVAEDTEGNILVATNNRGLLQWNKHIGRFDSVKAIDAIGAFEIRKLHVAKNGGIWLALDETPVLYEPQLNSIPKWLEYQQIASKVGRPYAFLEDDTGNIFIGGSLGLAVVSLRKQLVTKIDIDMLGIPGDFSVTALVFDKHRNLIFGTDRGILASIDIRTGEILGQLAVGEDTSKFIPELLFYNDTLLIGTDDGMYFSDASLTIARDIELSGLELSHSDIHTLYKDGQYIWVGTYSGLDILTLAPFELFNEKNSSIYDDILAITEDESGKLWLGTYNGLYHFEKKTGVHEKFETPMESHNLNDQRIGALAVKDNYLWIGFYQGGVQAVETTTGEVFTPSIELENDMLVSKIVTHEANQNVWVATLNLGLFRIKGKNTFSYYKNGSLPEKTIEFVFITNSGKLFASTREKFYKYEEATDSFFAIDIDFGIDTIRPRIFSSIQDKNGNIWLGTKDHGLFLWTLENQKSNVFQLEMVGDESELENATIYGIREDGQGNLWCSTQNGIIKLDHAGKLIAKFTKFDGLQGNDFNADSSFISSDGHIYFGGAYGYNKFDPSEIVIDSTPSPMRMTGINYPGRLERKIAETIDLQSLQLTHKDRFVTFQFSVLDLIHPEKNQFRYMLENFDPDWIENGTRNTATYTNLPAGEYLFRVQGANSAGIWNREGLSLNVRMLPKPWKTWWAYCCYALAALIAGWIFHRIYHSYAIDRHSAEQARAMFEAENRADDDMQEQLELQDELVQSAYRHNLATLSLVSECISQQAGILPDDSIEGYSLGNIKRIEALSCLEDCLYYQVGGPVANLQKYTDSIIPKLLMSAPIDPESIITINEIPTRLLPAELASPLAIVLFELLENCFQHAFEGGSPANYIYITLEAKPSEMRPGRDFELCVRDSGVGITGSIEDLSNEHSGIAIVQSIVNKLGGTIELVTNAGTAITVNIPEPGV